MRAYEKRLCGLINAQGLTFSKIIKNDAFSMFFVEIRVKHVNYGW